MAGLASDQPKLSSREVFFSQKDAQEAEDGNFIATLTLYNDEAPNDPILIFDQIICREVQIADLERVQKVVTFRRTSELYVFGRDVRVIQLSGVAFDGEDTPDPEGGGTRNQMAIIELAHWRYFRETKLAEQKRSLFLDIAGLSYKVGASALGRASVSDAPQYDTVNWRFMVLDDLSRNEDALRVVRPSAVTSFADTPEGLVEVAQFNRTRLNKPISRDTALGRSAASLRARDALVDEDVLAHAISIESLEEALQALGLGEEASSLVAPGTATSIGTVT